MNPHAFERFLAGDDMLSALLRAQPAFEPPADMAVKFAAHARAAQKARRAMQAEAATPAAPMQFEPPASLAANVLAEARRLEAAQMARQSAVLGEIQQGKPAAEVLGNRVSDATAAWLAARAARMATQASEQQAQTLQRARKPGWQRWLPQLGVLCSLAFVAGVALHVWQAGQPLSHTYQPTLPSEAQAPAPAAVAAPAAASTPHFTLEERQIAELDMRGKHGPPASAHKAAETRAALARLEPEQLFESTSTNAEETLKQDAEHALADAAPKPAPAAPAPPPPAPAMTSLAPAPAAAAPAPAAVAKKAAAANMLLRSGVAAPPSVTVQLSTSPREVATAWLNMAGQRLPTIHAAHPDDPAVMRWLDGFREALPEALRQRPLSLIADDSLDETELRLVP